MILDVMLPGADGLDLCAERRAAGDETPVLVLSARVDDDTDARAVRAGADAQLAKPFRLADLEERVRDLLARGTR